MGIIGVVRVPRTGLGLFLAVCLAGASSGCGDAQAQSPIIGRLAGRHAIRSSVCEKTAKYGTVITRCAVFRGTVSEAPKRHPDGDVAFNASPDPGYAGMLNATNRAEGGLHIEIVPSDQPGCTPGQPVTLANGRNRGACSGRDVHTPPLGAHVRIIGAWVLDGGNHWYEIHPAWKIKILRRAGA